MAPSTPAAFFAPFRLPAGPGLSAGWLHWLGTALTAAENLPLPAPPAAWAAALPALDAHRLAPLLYSRLQGRAVAAPAEFVAALAAAFRASAVRSLGMEMELRRLCTGLAAAAVPCLLLKGAALGRLVYASPAERPVSDLDLLVPREGFPAAARVLAGLGFRLHGPGPQGRLGRRFYRYRAELPAVGTRPENRGLLVELHWSLAELPYYMDRIDMAEVWEAARPLPAAENGRRTAVQDISPGQAQASEFAAHVPDPAVLLLHACAHLVLHHSRDLRLIWLVDLDRLARAGVDWDRVIALAGRWGLAYAAMACLAATQRWLGTPLPPPVVDALAVAAEDPAGRAMWGLGDEALAGRWWRRAWATWAAFDARQRVRYAGWLALRALLRPTEWLARR